MSNIKTLRDALKQIAAPVENYNDCNFELAVRGMERIARKALAATEGMEADPVGAGSGIPKKLQAWRDGAGVAELGEGYEPGNDDFCMDVIKLMTAYKSLRAALADHGLMKLAFEQCKDRLKNAEEHIERLESAALAERGTVGEPSQASLLLREILQDYFIEESEYNSVEFDAVFGRYSVDALVTELYNRVIAANATNPAPVGDGGLPVQASVADDPKFLNWLRRYWPCGSDADAAYEELVAYIDAQRAHAAPQVSLIKWAELQEPIESDWDSGYEAARSYVKIQLAPKKNTD